MYYHSLNEELRRRFGGKVYKLSLSSGCSCPNRDGTLGTRGCLFCDGAGAFAETGDIPAQLRRAKACLHGKEGEGRYIAYFQSFTNTYAPASCLRPLFTAAMAPEEVVALSVATRPDCLPPEILDLLAELNRRKPVWVELGLQTIHPESAAYLRRGYELPVFEEAVRALRARGIEVIVHLILGIPGETREDMIASARYAGQWADGVKLHLLHVLDGTDLAAEYAAGRVRPLEREEYFGLLEDCLRVLPSSVVIHRLTGDGDKRRLLTPLWSADKKTVLNAMRRRFEADGLVQGSALGE